MRHMPTSVNHLLLSCKFIVSNYWQALEILEGESALRAAMAAAGIDDVSEFPTRLADEMKFLKGLMKESDEDSLQMEYYQRLVNFADRRVTLELAIKEGSTASKTVRRHAQENYDKALAEVQETELKMGVVDRWLPTSKAWADAAELVSTKRYRLALLKLERLVVQQMFELTKMNLSQTGYKLRKHIAKALQARSQAIHNALKTYNAAAASIVPQGRKLSWDEDPETFGQVKPWSTPAARILLDKYFKIERAREEIQRCNIEIRRLITHIRDEREFLIRREAEVRETDPELAWEIRQYRWERGRYDGVHIKRFAKLAADAGPLFTGTLEPGVHRPRPVPPSPSTPDLHPGSSSAVDDLMHPARGIPCGPQEAAAMMHARTMEAGATIKDTRDEIDDDIGEREEGERIAEELDIVYRISDDLMNLCISLSLVDMYAHIYQVGVPLTALASHPHGDQEALVPPKVLASHPHGDQEALVPPRVLVSCPHGDQSALVPPTRSDVFSGWDGALKNPFFAADTVGFVEQCCCRDTIFVKAIL
ncbi:hypothetical protein C8R46DRAFT_1032044 [Mycena filopes]|nr:hypothetical protein C8R46DRAFT_1032044 [Mycena filopes]